MQTIEELSPELFTYELYDSGGILMDDIEIAQSAIGYCDASRLQVRPRTGLLALMLEFPNGDRCWFHIDEKMLKSLELRKQRLMKK